MNEHAEVPDVGDDPAAAAGAAGAPRTGDPAVDQVLRSLDGLAQRPGSEHVAVFEAAHEALRTALDQAGDGSDATPSGRPGHGV